MIRLLVVEDDHDVQGLLQTVLEVEGYQVSTLNNGTEVLSTVQQTRPDVVILDLMMPLQGGVEVLSILKAAHVRVPVLVISAYLQQAAGESLVAEWGAAFLAKPFSLNDLLTCVKMLVNRGTP